MYVHMYVCTYVCTYVHIYIMYTYVYIYIHTYRSSHQHSGPFFLKSPWRESSKYHGRLAFACRQVKPLVFFSSIFYALSSAKILRSYDFLDVFIIYHVNPRFCKTLSGYSIGRFVRQFWGHRDHESIRV